MVVVKSRCSQISGEIGLFWFFFRRLGRLCIWCMEMFLDLFSFLTCRPAAGFGDDVSERIRRNPENGPLAAAYSELLQIWMLILPERQFRWKQISDLYSIDYFLPSSGLTQNRLEAAWGFADSSTSPNATIPRRADRPCRPYDFHIKTRSPGDNRLLPIVQ